MTFIGIEELAALRVIARGTLDRHPEVQIILGHWGELLLFCGDMTDSPSRIAGLERKVSEYIRSNFYITSRAPVSSAGLRIRSDLASAVGDHLPGCQRGQLARAPNQRARWAFRSC